MAFPASKNEHTLSEQQIARSITETKLLTVEDLDSWQQPRFQRPLRVNTKVMQFSEELKDNGGMISGVISLGQLPGDPALYKVDGAHRVEAAKLSGLPEFIAEVRITRYSSLAEMAEDFVRLNSSLVRMRVDDILRGLEENTPTMHLLREQCPFIGYDNVRRANTSSKLVSMSAVLRAWQGSARETPSIQGSIVVTGVCEFLTEVEVQNLSVFLNVCHAAWGDDPEYYRLWGTLNLTMCMWVYRQVVLSLPGGQKRRTQLNAHQFKNCLTSLSADPSYIEWLTGRNMGERDRSPCYRRMKGIFVKRLTADTRGKAPRFPSPAWFVNK